MIDKYNDFSFYTDEDLEEYWKVVHIHRQVWIKKILKLIEKSTYNILVKQIWSKFNALELEKDK